MGPRKRTTESATALVLCAVLASCGKASGNGAPPLALPAFDAERAWKDLEAQVAIGPRPAGTPEAERTRAYLEQEMKAAGLAPVREAFEAETPAGKLSMANLYADVPPRSGGAAPIVILASHYDTKRLAAFVGANDGASSTAVLLELARILGPRERVALRFLFLDGEEAVRSSWVDPDNRYGSRHHAAELGRSGLAKRVKAFVLLDMVGDKDLGLLRDQNSDRALLECFFDAAKQHGLGGWVDVGSEPILDDHLSFRDVGIKSCDLIDFRYGPNNQYWHTTADTLDKCSAASLRIAGEIVLRGLPRVERLVLGG